MLIKSRPAARWTAALQAYRSTDAPGGDFFVAIDNFTADDGAHGRQWWQLPLAES